MLPVVRSIIERASYTTIFSCKNNEKNKKRAACVLFGALEKYLLDLSKKVSEVMGSAAIDLSIMAKKANVCQKSTGIVKQPKPYLSSLHQLSALCDSTFESLTLIENHLFWSKEEKLKELESNHLVFGHKFQSYSTRENETLLQSAKNELDRLKERIDLYDNLPVPGADILRIIAFRIRKEVPDYVIEKGLKASEWKEVVRCRRYNELEASYTHSLLKFNEVQNRFKQLELSIPLIDIPRSYAPEKSTIDSMLECLSLMGAQLFESGLDIKTNGNALFPILNDLTAESQNEKKRKSLSSSRENATSLTPFLEDSLSEIQRDLEKSNILPGLDVFAKPFDVSPNATKRDLSPFFQILKSTQHKLLNFHGIHANLKKAAKENLNEQIKVIKQLVNIQKFLEDNELNFYAYKLQLDALTTQEDKDPTLQNSTFHVNDKVRLNKQMAQVQGEIESFKKLGNEIQGKWNESCFALDELNHRLKYFEWAVNITAKCAEYSLIFESIQGSLRDTRKHCINRADHLRTFYLCNNKFNLLSTAILNHRLDFFYNPPDSDNEDVKLQMSCLENIKPIEIPQLCLKHQYFKAVQIDEKLSPLNTKLKENDGADLGLIWILPETKTSTLDELTKRRNRFALDYTNRKIMIQADYKRLEYVCNLATKELNLMRSTFEAVNSPLYDEKFNEAYQFKAVQKAKDAITALGAMVPFVFSGEKDKNWIYSPFDPNHLANRK